MKFKDLRLEPALLDGIEMLGFEETTPIQEHAIPAILDDKDLIACAQTGTGKTAAFLIPLINRLMQKESTQTRALIITPTRELAQQIDQNVDALSYYTGVSSVPIYGGKDSSGWDRQKYAITNGVDIVVATPGRLIMHMALGYVDFTHIETVILDEADKMLDMGFHADIIKLIADTPKTRQTLLFSATMPRKIRDLAKEIMNEPKELNFNLAKPAEGINQLAFSVYDEQKIDLLVHLLKEKEVDSMIIFASSKMSVDKIDRQLRRMKFQVKAMHSDKTQEERTQTLREFKNKEFRILVGTDVLARGIDIDNLSHVVNFDVPRDAEDYVHRVGRTARANTTGEAITFINPRDQGKFSRIEKLIEKEIPKPAVPEELGETPRYAPRKGGGGNDRRGRSSNGKSGGNRRREGGGGGRNFRRNGSGNQSQGKSNNRNRNRKRKPNNHSQRSNQNGGQQGPQNKPENGATPKAEQEGVKKKKSRHRRRKRKPNSDSTTPQAVNQGAKPSQD